MKIAVLFLLLIGRLQAAPDTRTFLRAIAQVESGGDDRAVGPCGARGRYQLSVATWMRFAPSGWPHVDAHNSVKSEVVALRNAASLRERFMEQAGGDEKGLIKFMAAGWLVGANATESAIFSPRAVNYAERVWNLYEERKARE